MTETKKVTCRLVGVDGNAFSLMGAWRRAAQQQGWSEADISEVIGDAQSGDYNHLLLVLSRHCEEEGF